MFIQKMKREDYERILRFNEVCRKEEKYILVKMKWIKQHFIITICQIIYERKNTSFLE
ncbi:hypothetical protein SAMN05421788_101198 [Filimonas lacunae]|uniref:Uncharacterized protein n=1 Tax=Filimonas lacunae TaxID=477680 RepID=A0A1N7KH78_9BACT|nr:hypothetical protein SAMN05421788_101198 [Filimonas lacunae]